MHGHDTIHLVVMLMVQAGRHHHPPPTWVVHSLLGLQSLNHRPHSCVHHVHGHVVSRVVSVVHIGVVHTGMVHLAMVHFGVVHAAVARVIPVTHVASLLLHQIYCNEKHTPSQHVIIIPAHSPSFYNCFPPHSLFLSQFLPSPYTVLPGIPMS